MEQRNKQNRYVFFSLITLLVSFLWQFSCVRVEEPSQGAYGDTLIISSHGKPSIINPVLTTGTFSAVLVDILFDGLIKLDKSFEPHPNLAESWDVSEDSLWWTIHLRKRIKFHDGVELTAEDVKFTFDQIRDPRNKGPYFNSFTEIKQVLVKDRYTLQLILSKPFAALHDSLLVGILPKHLFEKENLQNNKWNYQPVGSGPFRLVKWSEDEIVLEANDDYFLGRPYLHSIRVNFVANQKVAWVHLLSEQADFMPLLVPEDFEKLIDTPSMNIYSYLKPFYYVLLLNNNGGLSVRRNY